MHIFRHLSSVLGTNDFRPRATVLVRSVLRLLIEPTNELSAALTRFKENHCNRKKSSLGPWYRPLHYA